MKGACNHQLGIMSSMTTEVTPYEYIRICSVCKISERLPRAGKTYTGYSIEAESKRDFERREYAKDIIQAHDARGNVTEAYHEAYGDPQERGKAGKGKAVEELRIKE